AQLSLDRTTIRAPFDARILDTRLDVGQVVNGSAAVGTMFSVASVEIAVPVSAEERKLIGPLDGQTVSVIPPDVTATAIPGRLLRVAAALDERTRLGTLFVATDNPAALTVGEFVEVQIDGADAPNAYRLPAAAMTSRDQLWVVADGRLASRTVDVIGREAELAVVRVFDDADGVVIVPPANARDGLPVTGRTTGDVAAAKNRTD
ncbi:MAG: HlyD family efflux transporter periplasmic adaptor subunit, partial [Woeseiaceae bacterium]